MSPAVTALGVVWLCHVDITSDGFLVLLCRYVGAKLSHTGLPKFVYAAGDTYVRLLECHAVALYPQAGDANAAQDVPYAFPHDSICGHLVWVVSGELFLDHLG